ncbi:transposase domain-containing protein [Holosporaceae bacterium 'Namur']|nr:transposase domain-containing protein [Holosporaceae bacterium 'Namur']
MFSKTYLEDGRVRVDNNDCEGAKANATIYSIIQTCKANNIKAYAFFCFALQNIRKAGTEEQLRALLPYNIDKKLLA